jgi:hypothetical protein
MADQIDILGSIFKTVGVKNVQKAKEITVTTGVIVGGMLVLVIAYRIAKNRKDRLEAKEARRYDAKDMGDELSDISVSSRNLSISKGDAIMIAQNLLTAMDKWGTDEEAIFSALESLQTKDDLILVIQTFGVKPYSGTGLAESWWTRTGYKNLNGWLRAELNRSDQKRVKAEYDRLGVPF